MSEQINRQQLETNIAVQAYKDESYKQKLLNNPKELYEQELGIALPENTKVQVLQENADTIYLVLPSLPQVDEELSDEALEQVAGGQWIAIRHEHGMYFIDSQQKKG